MFEQHPVPQQISSYQFRLVGDMTLKQFFQLAVGAVLGLIIYSLPLPGFFKWPMIVISVVAGAAFAFLPIQDRPLEQWLVAFFRSIYAPTLFVWKKTGSPDQYFAADTQASADTPVEEVPQSLPADNATRNLEAQEKDFLSKLSHMLGGKHTAGSPAVAETPPPPVTPVAPIAPSEQKQPLVVPTAPSVQVPVAGFNQPPTQTPVTTSVVTAPLTQSTTPQTQNADFSPEAAPPSPPTMPNTVVGQVMDSVGKIVEGAILEITDTDGRPVRALKTNKAGHFMIVTPLPNGEYKIAIEKEGLNFEPLSFRTTGELIMPIAIKSKDALPDSAAPYRAVWSV